LIFVLFLFTSSGVAKTSGGGGLAGAGGGVVGGTLLDFLATFLGAAFLGATFLGAAFLGAAFLGAAFLGATLETFEVKSFLELTFFLGRLEDLVVFTILLEN